MRANTVITQVHNPWIPYALWNCLHHVLSSWSQSTHNSCSRIIVVEEREWLFWRKFCNLIFQVGPSHLLIGSETEFVWVDKWLIDWLFLINFELQSLPNKNPSLISKSTQRRFIRDSSKRRFECDNDCPNIRISFHTYYDCSTTISGTRKHHAKKFNTSRNRSTSRHQTVRDHPNEWIHLFFLQISCESCLRSSNPSINQ